MPRPPIESIDELRTVLAEAVPVQHRARVATLGRMLLSAIDSPAPQAGEPTAATSSPQVPAQPPQPPPNPQSPPNPRLDRLLELIKTELDKNGIQLPDARYRSRIPLVMRPRIPTDNG